MQKNSYKIRSYLTAVLTRMPDNVEVEFHSTVHVEKVCKMTISYSPDFTDAEITRDADFIKFVNSRYGVLS